MAGTSVVIMRDGSRTKLPVDLDRPLHELLHAFCSSVVGVSDSTAFTLLSGTRGLDMTLTARQNNVVANAILMCAPRVGGSALGAEVRVAVQTSTGERAQGSFTAGTTLADVVLGLASGGGITADASRLADTAFTGVSIVFMRTQVSGADLRNTSLANLGATKGSVSLRLQLPKEGTVAAAAPAVEAAGMDVVGQTAAAGDIPAPAPAPADSVMACDTDAITPSGAGTESRHIPVAPVPAVMPLPCPSPQQQADPVNPHVSAPQPVAVTAMHVDADTAAGTGANPVRTAVAATRAAVSRLRAAAWDKEAGEALLTVVKILDNVVARPGDTKVRTLRYGNPKFQAAVGQYGGAIDVLCAAGFAVDSSRGAADIAYVLTAEGGEDDAVTLAVRGVAAAEAMVCGVTGIGPPPAVNHDARALAAAEAARVVQVFDPYKPMLMRVEADAGAGLRPAIKVLDGTNVGVPSLACPVPSSSPMTGMERKVADLKARAAALQDAAMPSDRATRVFLHEKGAAFTMERFSAAEIPATEGEDGTASSSGQAAAQLEDVDTEHDGDAVRLQMEVLKKKRADKEEADKGFRTLAMRELEILSKAKVFTVTLIRLVLPDRTVIQGTFSPRESLHALGAWVGSLLTAGAPPFFLYTTPPPSLLDCSLKGGEGGDRTLAEAKLQPAAVLYLGWGKGLGQRLAPGDMPTDPSQYLTTAVLASAASAAASSSSFPSASIALVPTEQGDGEALEAAASALLVGTARTGAGAGAGAGKAKGKPGWLKL